MSDRAFYGPADSWLEDYKVVYAEDYYKLERELAEASETLNAVLAGATKQAIELTAHKAALEKANTALLAITSSRFYQSTCRGGEMERLMNQAIEALKGSQ